MKTEARRPYRQRARAEAAADKTQRILAAAEKLFGEYPYDRVSLADVAAHAGVGLQTLIRRYRTKEDLVHAVTAVVGERVTTQRGRAPVGDVRGAVANLVEHYEMIGDLILRVLAQEDRVPPFAEATAAGRRQHRDWTTRVFAPMLDGLPAAERALRRAQLVAICDVYVWKLLRRDQKLSRERTERALVQMIESLEGIT